MTIATCVVADAESKRRLEATVRVAKADLMPTEANLLPAYPNFAALEAAREDFCDEVTAAGGPAGRRGDGGDERHRLHRSPAAPDTAAFGVTRTVGANTPVIAHDCGEYSVSHRPAAGRHDVGPAPRRRHRDHPCRSGGAAKVACHDRTTPGAPAM